MPRITDNGPALACLRKLGYRRDLGRDVPGVQDAYWVMDGEGQRRRIKIQKRNASTSAPGQYRFGLGWRSFAQIESLVLWIQNRTQLLIIPSEFLLKVFEDNRASLLVNEHEQWEVKVQFTANGARLIPVGLGTTFDLTPYVRIIPADPPTPITP